MGLVLAAAATTAACSDGGSTCTPGEQTNCGCPGGEQGVQLCLPDGTFGLCECVGASSSASTSTTTSSASSGQGGGGGMAPCAPAAVEDCYDGPSGTQGVGPCVSGTRICGSDGMWGACMGQVLPMPEACQTVEDEDCDGATPACAAPWVVDLGDGSSIMDLEVDAAGNVYVIGHFAGTIDFGGGNTMSDAGVPDVFIAKLSPNGAHVWSKQLGDPLDQISANDLLVDGAGNVYASVGFFGSQTLLGEQVQSEGNRDIALMRFQPDGTLDWLYAYGSTGYDEANKLALDAGGNLVVGAFHEAAIFFGGMDVLSGAGYAVVSLAPDASFLWGSQLFPGSGDVAVDPVSGDVLVLGSYTGTVDLGMGPVMSWVEGGVFFGRISTVTGDVLDYRASGGPATISPIYLSLEAYANGDQLAVINYYNNLIDLGQSQPVPTTAGYVAARIDAAGEVTWLDHYYAPNPMGYALTFLAAEPTLTDAMRLVGFASGSFDLGDGMIADSSFVLTVAGDGSYVDALTYPLSLIFTDVGRASDGVDIVCGVHTGAPEMLAGELLMNAPSGSGFVARLAP